MAYAAEPYFLEAGRLKPTPQQGCFLLRMERQWVLLWHLQEVISIPRLWLHFWTGWAICAVSKIGMFLIRWSIYFLLISFPWHIWNSSYLSVSLFPLLSLSLFHNLNHLFSFKSVPLTDNTNERLLLISTGQGSVSPEDLSQDNLFLPQPSSCGLDTDVLGRWSPVIGTIGFLKNF